MGRCERAQECPKPGKTPVFSIRGFIIHAEGISLFIGRRGMGPATLDEVCTPLMNKWILAILSPTTITTVGRRSSEDDDDGSCGLSSTEKTFESFASGRCGTSPFPFSSLNLLVVGSVHSTRQPATNPTLTHTLTQSVSLSWSRFLSSLLEYFFRVGPPLCFRESEEFNITAENHPDKTLSARASEPFFRLGREGRRVPSVTIHSSAGNLQLPLPGS